MKITHLEQTKVNKVSPFCTAVEYPNGDKNIWGAVIEITGRYPTRGWTINHKVTELVYVIAGLGILGVDGKEYKFKKGDQITIAMNERFWWKGKAILFMPCAPAWYPSQHETVG